jgi:hypothetical protein
MRVARYHQYKVSQKTLRLRCADEPWSPPACGPGSSQEHGIRSGCQRTAVYHSKPLTISPRKRSQENAANGGDVGRFSRATGAQHQATKCNDLCDGPRPQRIEKVKSAGDCPAQTWRRRRVGIPETGGHYTSTTPPGRHEKKQRTSEA